MKILAAADLHGDISLARSLASRAEKENVDAIILCGDIVKSETDVQGIVGEFSKINKKIFLLPGNHETNATINFLSELYNAQNLHAYALNLTKEIGIFGCGSANIGPFGMHDEDILNYLRKGHRYISKSKKKIMITHAHPAGTLMEKLSQFIPGSPGIKQAVDELQPDFLLCGHVHEADGIEELIGKTRVINVGRKGKILEI